MSASLILPRSSFSIHGFERLILPCAWGYQTSNARIETRPIAPAHLVTTFHLSKISFKDFWMGFVLGIADIGWARSGARPRPWRRCTPQWVWFLLKMPMCALLNLKAAQRAAVHCVVIIASRWAQLYSCPYFRNRQCRSAVQGLCIS